jgi:hypothetical protein
MADDISCLHELFPAWSIEDLNALYQDLGRSIDLVISRISEGHASQWSSSLNTLQTQTTSSNPRKNHRVTAFRPKTNSKRTIVEKSGRKSSALHHTSSSSEMESTFVCSPAEIIVSQSNDGYLNVDECLKSEIVNLPSSLGLAMNEVLDSPVVVLPNIHPDLKSHSVDRPLVNLPYNVRCSDACAAELSYCSVQNDKVFLSPSVPALDELFPDSVRKSRPNSKTSVFY